MSYAKKKRQQCQGGMKHPNRDLKCWGKHDPEEEGHWAYMTDKGELRKITWRD